MVNQFRRQTYLWVPILLAVCILLVVNPVTSCSGVLLRCTPDAGSGRAHLPKSFSLLLVSCSSDPNCRRVVNCALEEGYLLAPELIIVALSVGIHPAHVLQLQWALIAALCAATVVLHLLYVYWRRRDSTGADPGIYCCGAPPYSAVYYAHFPIKYMIAILPVTLLLLQTVSGLSRSRMLAICGLSSLICVSYFVRDPEGGSGFCRVRTQSRGGTDRAARVASGEKVWYEESRFTGMRTEREQRSRNP